MYTLEQMIALYDLSASSYYDAVDQRATKTSITNHFGIQLPADFVQFVTESKLSPDWFVGFGEDYNSGSHMIHINSYTRKIRKRRQGKFVYVKPDNFIVFNLGFDQDYDCFDVNQIDPETGQYTIVYWYPTIDTNEGLAIGEVSKRTVNFSTYLERIINRKLKALNSKNIANLKRPETAIKIEKAKQILQIDSLDEFLAFMRGMK